MENIIHISQQNTKWHNISCLQKEAELFRSMHRPISVAENSLVPLCIAPIGNTGLEIHA